MEGVWVAIVVAISSVFTTLIAPPLMAIVVARVARGDEERRERRQDQVAQRLVEANKEIAREARMVADSNAKKLAEIAKINEATHKIVNNQRTVMLRQVAVLARLYANDHPELEEAQLAAEQAEQDSREAQESQNLLAKSNL